MEDRKNCDDTVDALEAADQLIDRMQDKVVDMLKPDSGATSEDLAGEMIAELETAPEIDKVRETLGRDPDRFGSHPGPRDG